MIHKKVYKRFLSSLLALTIFFQSFTSMEFPSFAAPASASDSLEAYTEESNYEEVEEDSFFNDSEDESPINEVSSDEEVIYDDEGVEVKPLSPEAIELLRAEETYESENPVIPKKGRIAVVDDAIYVGVVVGILIYGLYLYGISKYKTSDVINYWNNYSFPSHTYTFKDVDFSYINSFGVPITTKITAAMMDRWGEEITGYRNNDPWNSSLALTNNDKLVLAYTMLQQNLLINVNRSNVRVTNPVNVPTSRSYPYYVMAATSDTNLIQLRFDKKPVGAFYNNDSGSTTFYDYSGNLIKVSGSSPIFYSGIKKIIDSDGVEQLAIDYCNVSVYGYPLNRTTGFFECDNSFVEYCSTPVSDQPYKYELKTFSPSSIGMRCMPFNIYICKGISSSQSNNFKPSAKFLSSFYPTTLSTPDLVDDYYRYTNIANVPRIGSISEYIDALPDSITVKEEYKLDNPLNLYGTSTFLNPAGVAGAEVVEPTVAPSESASVSPSNPDIGGGDVTGSLSNILAKIGEFFNWAKTSLSPTAFATAVATALGLNLLFQSISVPLNNMFEWVKTNISPSSFATAVATALGLSALFDTVVIPLSQILSKVNVISTISSTLNDIARWDIETWIGALADPLAHLLSIDDVLTNISDWDIDISIGGLATLLTNISSNIRDLALSMSKWTFSDWTAAMSQALKDIIEKPLVGIKSVADAIALALDNVASWDLAKALDALQKAVVNALTGTLTIAGIASLIEILTNIKDAIKELTSGKDLENPDSDSDSGFLSLAKLLYLLLLIIILLIIIFINCLRFIVSIFSIPASTALLNADVLKGIDFVKSLRLERFNLSLYDLIVVIVNFLLFVSIIKALKRKIDTLRL